MVFHAKQEVYTVLLEKLEVGFTLFYRVIYLSVTYQTNRVVLLRMRCFLADQ